MGDRWTVDPRRGTCFDGQSDCTLALASALGITRAEAEDLIVEVLNGDSRTNPPKVDMVPWAEVDTKPGMHLPAEGDRWADYRTFPDQRLYAYEGEGHSLAIYVPGDMVPVRSSNGKQA